MDNEEFAGPTRSKSYDDLEIIVGVDWADCMAYFNGNDDVSMAEFVFTMERAWAFAGISLPPERLHHTPAIEQARKVASYMYSRVRERR